MHSRGRAPFQVPTLQRNSTCRDARCRKKSNNDHIPSKACQQTASSCVPSEVSALLRDAALGKMGYRSKSNCWKFFSSRYHELPSSEPRQNEILKRLFMTWIFLVDITRASMGASDSSMELNLAGRACLRRARIEKGRARMKKGQKINHEVCGKSPMMHSTRVNSANNNWGKKETTTREVGSVGQAMGFHLPFFFKCRPCSPAERSEQGITRGGQKGHSTDMNKQVVQPKCQLKYFFIHGGVQQFAQRT